MDAEGEDVFSGSHEELESTAQQLCTSPSRPQQLHLDSLSLKMPQNIHQSVPPTPGTALQHKIEYNLGSQINIQIQQQMGVFKASILQAFQSFKVEMKSVKQTEEMVDQIPSLDN